MLTQIYDDYLAHHGIKGQHWGTRRFQNEDGTLTSAGKARYNSPEGGTRLSGSVAETKKLSGRNSNGTIKKIAKAAAITAAAAGIAYASYRISKNGNISLNDLKGKGIDAINTGEYHIKNASKMMQSTISNAKSKAKTLINEHRASSALRKANTESRSAQKGSNNSNRKRQLDVLSSVEYEFRNAPGSKWIGGANDFTSTKNIGSGIRRRVANRGINNRVSRVGIDVVGDKSKYSNK